MVSLLREGVDALGAERGVFISFVRDDRRLLSCRFTLACDAGWCRKYLEAGGITHDPWLAYATHHVEPTIAATRVNDEREQQVLDIAERHGFASAVLAPVHSSAGHARSSLLVLGSATRGYFEAANGTDALRLLRIGARLLAGQLHDWWLATLRSDLLRRARLTDLELQLLGYERLGWSSKRIASETGLTKNSIDSRFQRINLKLGVPNRAAAARLALDFGVISAMPCG